MPHGHPDWGAGAQRELVYGVQDLAELAVRLGAPGTRHRSGDVVYHTDFAAGLGGWRRLGEYDEDVVYLVEDPVWTGPYAAELEGGGGDENAATIERHLGALRVGRVGLEVIFTVRPDTATVDIMMYTILAGRVHTNWVIYDHENTRLRLRPGLAVYTLDDDIALRDDYPSFHMLKMVTDTALELSGLVILDDAVYTAAAGYSTFGGLSAEDAYTVIHVAHRSVAAKTESIYVGGVILTENEP